MYPSSTPQQQQQPTSIRRAQLSNSSRQLGREQDSKVLLGGGNVRFPCRGVSPPSPRQQPAAPPKQHSGNHPSACMRRTLFLLPSPQQQQRAHQAAQLNNSIRHSSLSLGPPPPGHKSSPEVQTPGEGRAQPKCQHQQPTSRVTGACCPPRSRGDPPVLRRGQARYFPSSSQTLIISFPGSARQRLAPPPPRTTHNQPLHHSSKSMTRLPLEKPTITRLPQDQQTPVRHQLPSRTDSGIGSDSMRHSSISSVDSGHGSFPTSPVRQAAAMVRSPGARPTASDFLRRQSSTSSTTSSHSAALDAEKRNRRRSAVVRGTSEDSTGK